MRILTFILMFGVLAGGFSACTHNDSDGDKSETTPPAAQTASTEKDVYTCPMHPSVMSDRPGACPVCGMALVKKSAQKETSEAELVALRQVSLSPTQRVIANVSTTPVVRKPISKEVTAVGVIDYAEPLQAKVAARFRGRIEQLYVNFTGEVVRKGEPLFELYSPDLVSAEQELILAVNAASNIVSTNGDHVHQNRLHQAARDRLRVHFGMTEEQIADVERAQQTRSTVTFYSPIHGTVINKQIQEGQYVDEGMLLYQLADLSKVWIYLDVYEKDVRFVKLGQSVTIASEAYPGETFTGRVTFIDPTLSGETRTVRVRTEFPNQSGKLKPQMYVKASIQLPATDALVIPSSAVLATGRRNVVWVETKSNTFEPRNVALGIHTDAICEVLDGLSAGESVVTTGGFLLESESQLQQPTQVQSGAATPAIAHEHGRNGGKKSADASGEIKIVVDGKFTPDIIHAKKGEKVTIAFERHEDSKCSEEVVFKQFDIRKKLPIHKITTIELTPKNAGEYLFTCGMGMLEGKLIVQ